MNKVIVLTSRNAKKADELAALLGPLGWQLRSVSEFSDVEPDESGSTFIENALIKARHAAQVSGLPAIADDSGLCVDAIQGAPGVRSARYAGEPSSDAANNEKLLAEMASISEPAQRGAYFVCTLALLRTPQDPIPLIAEGFWRGEILREARGEHGFGYDPLFYVSEHQCASAQLDPALKNRISHRGQAMQKMLSLIGAM